MYQTEWNQLSPWTVDETETHQRKQADGLENQGRKYKIVHVSPRGVVSFFQTKEDGNNVFFFGKSITNVTIKLNQLTCSATAFPKTALLRG